MESTIAVIVFFMCIAYVQQISAKIDVIGTNDNSHLSSDIDYMHLDTVDLPSDFSNCHDACLQKVCGEIFLFLLFCFECGVVCVRVKLFLLFCSKKSCTKYIQIQLLYFALI